MRRAFVAGNWKMHGSVAQVSDVLGALREELGQGLNGVDVAVCPPVPYLGLARQLLDGSELLLGAQNVWYEQSGAFTGEVSPGMLSEFAVRLVLVGHSERRQLFGEDDALVARKFMAVKAMEQIPVLCVGETLEERERGHEESAVDRQLQAVIDAGGVQALERAVVAYEPVWAIGTGRTATPDQAQAMHAYIRRRVAEYGREQAAQLRIVYGGSVNAENAAELFACPDIDGGLIGGASLDAASFTGICKSVS